MTHYTQETSWRATRAALLWLALGLLISWLVLTNVSLPLVPHYLNLHTILETLAISVAALIFGLGWNAYMLHSQTRVLISSVGFLAVGLLDFAHTMSFAGMPDYFTANSSAKGINFWLAARYLAALTLLAAALWPEMKNSAATTTQASRRRLGALLVALTLVALTHLWFMAYPQTFPDTFIPGLGLTLFKRQAEYGVIALYLITTAVLYWQLRTPRSFNVPMLLGAAATMAMSELFFTSYEAITDYFNLLGHLYKVVAYWMLYKSLFVDSIAEPYYAVNESRQHLLAIQNAIPDLVCEMDSQGRYLDVRGLTETFLGQPTAPLLGRTVHQVMPVEAAQVMMSALGEAYAKGFSHGRMLHLKGADAEHWFELSISFKGLNAAQTPAFIVLSRDVTQRMQDQDTVYRLNYFDALTGLPNRLMFTTNFAQALSLTQRAQGTLALVYLDLDNFKHINESLGHLIGDSLLIEISQRLKDLLRAEDTLCRPGGDEFIMLLPLTDATGAAQAAHRLQEAVQKVHRSESYEMVVTSSIGIAMYPGDGKDFESLIQCAETAMNQAKEAGRDTYRFYSAAMQTRSARVLQLETGLRFALSQGQFEVHYQPQFRLHDRQLIGMEALLRWNHPELGRISPAEFIPIAEHSGQIVGIGAWVLHTAMTQTRRWVDAGHTDLVIAVNLSLAQFRHEGLVDQVRDLLAKTGLPPGNLELELTESITMKEPEQVIATVKQLHTLGVQLSIDDFGTGYSSLSHLKRLQVHKLKIDLSFVRDINHDGNDQSIVDAIIRMANGLGLSTIAEEIGRAHV